MNFLERLVADWYGHQGYLVRSNIRFGERDQGGYDGEIDVLALSLEKREVVHVETSSDADSWDERCERMLRKFKTAEGHYVTTDGPTSGFTVRQIAVVGVRPASKKNKEKAAALGKIEVLSIDELMGQIKDHVRKFNPASRAIPEGYGYLRAVQFAVWFGEPSKAIAV